MDTRFSEAEQAFGDEIRKFFAAEFDAELAGGIRWHGLERNAEVHY
jgi:hypothetical protein